MNCFLCKDTGIVQYFKREKSFDYEYWARCNCKSADNVPAIASAFAVLTELEIKKIIANNLQKFGG